MNTETPRTDNILGKLLEMGHNLHEGTCPEVLVKEMRRIEGELNDARARIARMDGALDLVLKMRSDWFEMQKEGFSGAYYAFVKGNDAEWETITKAKEGKP